MSKAGVNTTPNKQDTNQFKKENRGPTPSAPKDDKRQSSDNFTNQGGRGHHSSQHGNQQQHHSHNQNQNRDRSGNRNDNHQYDRNAAEAKTNEKDDKSLAEPAAGAAEKKFTGRCRLFVGNLTPDVTEDEFRKMFEPYGEVSEMYVNTSRGFGFIRLDYRQNAEAAKAALDGLQRKGRVLRVRFASHGAALKVKNLHHYVSNELLEQSFSQFGDLERCVVIVDDRGKPTGDGIVEFVRKPGANSALRRITEGVFLMGADPKPIAVEPLEQKDEEDGLPEKFLTRTDQYKKEREKEPRFAPPGTFEYEFGMRWKQIEDIEKQRIEQVKKDTEEARLKLEDEMQNALYEYQAEQIRQDLRRQQEELLRLEELRNQDRMRRQQEHEIRRQQEERERAQQEERRRADTMMLMRQHEMARGRGPMDIPGMRGREEMMMVDRYGDRMPERMGDRMPERMGDRMPDRMGDRMPDRMGDRMPDRMGDRMPDRMGERMPDRMGDRMPDRMGPGQPGFMWDDKQRAEAGMRGDAGRGRGSGAPPLQPPPVPPSSVNLERGGGGGPNVAATAGGAAQGRKSSSPKPLMQGSGFGGGPGAPAGSGPGSNTQNSSDVSAGGEDCAEETVSRLAETEETDSIEGMSDCSDVHETRPLTPCSATFHSPMIHGEEVLCGANILCQCSEECLCHSAIDKTCIEGTARAWEAGTDCVFYNGLEMFDKSAHLLSNLKFDKSAHSLSNSNTGKNVTADCLDEVLSKCVERSNWSSLANGSKLEKETGVALSLVEPSIGYISSPDNCSEHKCSQTMTGHTETIGDNCSEIENISNNLKHNTGCQCLDQTLINGTAKVAETSSHQHSSLNASSRNCFTSGHPEDICLSVGVCQNMQEEDNQPSVTSKLHQLSVNPLSGLPEQHPPPEDLHKSLSQIPAGFNNSPESNVCNCFQVSRIDSDSSVHKALNNKASGFNNNNNNNNNTDGEVQTCKHSLGNRDLKGLSSRKYYHDENIDDLMGCREINSPKDVSTFEQHQRFTVEDINNELVVEYDVSASCANSDVYQDQEGPLFPHYLTAAVAEDVSRPEVRQCDSCDGQFIEWGSEGRPDETLPNSQTSQSESFTACENTVAQDFDTSSDDQEVASTCSSVASSHPSERNHEAALCADDHTFKPPATRHPVAVTCMPTGCSIAYMSDMNCSVYGTAVVKALGRPVVISSPQVSFARRPGSTRMMQHQRMSTGGAPASARKHQALPHGMQATSVLQHRSLTNRGQTMVVQQRTMVTGLAQQTVIQQQVAAPTAMAQSAMMHMRQRALTAQQASLIQHRGIRYVPTGVLGAPLLQAQTIQSTSVIEGRTATLMGHGLVHGVNQSQVMQHLVQQRYLGGPIMSGRRVQLVAGCPVRLVNK